MFEESTHTEFKDSPNFKAVGGESDSKDSRNVDSASDNIRPAPGSEPSFQLDAQANLLRELIQKCKSLTERACDNAIRQARHSAHVEEMAGAELISARLQLKEKDEALSARDRALCESEALNREKIQSLENLLSDKELQLGNCQTRTKSLLEEIDGLNLRLNEAATAMKQAENRFREFAEHQESKIYELRGEIKAKDDLLQGREAALRQLEEQSRVAIRALERLLQNANIDLENKKSELREKEAALQLVANRDEAVTKLLQQLADESQKLMAELQEKNQLISELEDKSCHAFDQGAAYNSVVASQERLL